MRNPEIILNNLAKCAEKSDLFFGNLVLNLSSGQRICVINKLVHIDYIRNNLFLLICVWRIYMSDFFHFGNIVF